VIRVAQQGWDLNRQAETVDDVKTGVGCWWVEIDGVRIGRIIRVEWAAQDDEISVPRLVIDVADGMEIVYVDRDGEPLHGTPIPVESLPAIDYRTVIHRDDLTRDTRFEPADG
jgi:hypothetical protein